MKPMPAVAKGEEEQCSLNAIENSEDTSTI